MSESTQTQDDYQEIIEHEPKLTRYDKALAMRREWEAKRADFLTRPNPDPKLLAIINYRIECARAAMKRTQDDVTRKHEAIDDWRAGEGRKIRNASRRKVRNVANADLSEMTDAERARYKSDQAQVRAWRKRAKDRGLSDSAINADVAARIRARDLKRHVKQAEDAELQGLPDYGRF